MRTIKIEGTGPTAKGHRVYIDGVDISDCVQAVTVSICIGKPNTVLLRCVGNVELPPEIQALVSVEQVEQEETDGARKYYAAVERFENTETAEFIKDLHNVHILNQLRYAHIQGQWDGSWHDLWKITRGWHPIRNIGKKSKLIIRQALMDQRV